MLRLPFFVYRFSFGTVGFRLDVRHLRGFILLCLCLGTTAGSGSAPGVFESTHNAKRQTPNGERHAFHSSLAEVNYNTATKALEVSLRVFTDDLGTALSQEFKRKLVVDQSSAADPFIRQYLARHFGVSDARNARKPLVWVGKEIAVDVTWMYVEIPLPEGPDGLWLHNALLTDLFDDQVNIVNMDYKGQKRTYLFKPEQTRQELEF